MKRLFLISLLTTVFTSCTAVQTPPTLSSSPEESPLETMAQPVSTPSHSMPYSDQEGLLDESIKLLKVMLQAPNRTVNEEMLANSNTIVLFPLVIEEEYSSKAAFGNGVVSMRSPDGTWGPPIFHQLMGVNFGQWAGLKAWDLVFLVVSEKGRSAMFNPAYQFGQQVSMEFGPIDMHPNFSIQPYLSKRDIYVYSRAQGAFVGLGSRGGMINNNEGANSKFYGGAHSSKEILLKEGGIPLPEAAQSFIDELNKIAPAKVTINAT